MSRLAGWCSDNNLFLNVEKTKEIVVDFRRVHTWHAPLTSNSATVKRLNVEKFLGVHITEDLSWTNNTTALAKKAHQRLYFLRKLRRARAPAPLMCTFYRGTIESILTSCITVWYGAFNTSCRKSLQRIVRAAEKICWCLSPLPPGHLQHPSHPQSPLHCRWSHPPNTQLLQSAAIRKETAESPGQDQQTEGQLPPSGCQEAKLSPELAPTSPPLPHAPLNSDPPTFHNTPPPTYKLWPAPVTLCSIELITTASSIDCKLFLLTVWLKTVLWALITLTDC